jgi:short-subunit dehydrogenase
MSAVRATRSVLPAMLAAGKGAIVNVCSVNSALSDPAVLDYSAAKAALASFSKALSKEVGPRGIRVHGQPWPGRQSPGCLPAGHRGAIYSRLWTAT